MNLSRIIKWVVILGVIFVLWKFVVPKVKSNSSTSSTTTSATVAPASAASLGPGCSVAAGRASDAWGSGLKSFVNPPYDIGAWSSFRNDVESMISRAESECNCNSESCDKGRGAMKELRSLISDMDGSIRNGTEPPGDLVRRQDSIDTQINEARDLTRAGK